MPPPKTGSELDARVTFVGFGEDNKDKVQEVEFDMIHVTPPQSAPDFVRNSNLGITKLITHH